MSFLDGLLDLLSRQDQDFDAWMRDYFQYLEATRPAAPASPRLGGGRWTQDMEDFWLGATRDSDDLRFGADDSWDLDGGSRWPE